MKNTAQNNDATPLQDFLTKNFSRLQDEDGVIIDAIEEIADNLHDQTSKKILQNIKDGRQSPKLS